MYPIMKYSTDILRILMGGIFVSHGIARLYYQSLEDFGGFLSAKGLPLGFILAWVITIAEMVSGTLLMAGKFVRYCVLFHALVILAGILMVHLPNGWFVVGHGQGGMEYSILILAVLFFLYSHTAREPLQ